MTALTLSFNPFDGSSDAVDLTPEGLTLRWWDGDAEQARRFTVPLAQVAALAEFLTTNADAVRKWQEHAARSEALQIAARLCADVEPYSYTSVMTIGSAVMLNTTPDEFDRMLNERTFAPDDRPAVMRDGDRKRFTVGALVVSTEAPALVVAP